MKTNKREGEEGGRKEVIIREAQRQTKRQTKRQTIANAKTNKREGEEGG